MAESLPSRRRGGGQTGWRNQRRFGRDSIQWQSGRALDPVASATS